MRYLSLITLCLFCASCAPETVPQRVKIAPVVKREAVTPKLTVVVQRVEKTREVARELETKIDALPDHPDLKAAMVALETALDAEYKATGDAYLAGSLKDEETGSLRENETDYQINEKIDAKEITTLGKENAEMKPDHEFMTRVRWIIGGVVALAVLWAILKLLIDAGKLALPFPFNLLFIRKP